MRRADRGGPNRARSTAGPIDGERRRIGAGALAWPAVATFGPLLGVGNAHAQAGRVIVLGTDQAPRHFNAAVQSGVATMMPSAQIFASLFMVDDKWRIQPYAAASHRFEDGGKSLVVKLAPGQRFHDGKPLTSEDVAFSIMAVKANHPFSTMLGPVERVDTPDASTAVIRLSQPHPALLLALTAPLTPILPKHVYGDGQDLKNHPRNMSPVGSGPFKLAEFKPGEVYVLEKNAEFFIPGKPAADKLIVRLFRDPNAMVVGIERKELHLLPGFTFLTSILRLTNQSHVNVVDQSRNGIGMMSWLAFNTAKKPFDDPRVRRAVGFAIDKDFIVGKLHYGRTFRQPGPITTASPLYDDKLEPYKLDLARATRLLDEAGLKPDASGVRFQMALEIPPTTVDYNQRVAEYLRPQLKKIGIDVVLKPSPDFPTWMRRVSSLEFDATLDVVFNWGDPVIGVHRTYQSANIRKGVIWSNTQSYSNPRVDALMAQAAVEMDPARRKSLYQEFQRIVVDDAPIIFLTGLASYAIVDKRVSGLPDSIWKTMAPMLDLSIA
jgi:peptide/nickel transport system substrate-binding protein